MPKHGVVIHWFRKDLRLCDNPSLWAASREALQVLPVYVLSHWRGQHDWTGPKRQHFLCQSLASLRGNLQSIGSDLLLRCGDAVEELVKVAVQAKAAAIYFNRDGDPYGRACEERLKQRCATLGIACFDFKDRWMHDPSEVLTGSGGPYRVYTPYSRNWLALEKDRPLGKVKSLGPAPTCESLPLPELSHWGLKLEGSEQMPEGGERAARKRLDALLSSELLCGYGAKRDLPAEPGTSRLGQDLRFGLLGIRELYGRCVEFAQAGGSAAVRASVHTYLKELAWREFYAAVLWYYPQVFELEFNAEFRGMEWPGSVEDFQRWCQGRTGFPIVDAGIAELRRTGFMHNRVRMIVAMFLTKDLHCDWRWGESFFMQHLLDGENASNNGGWQWSAGTGADAAPYFRIQNPWSQTKRFDPQGLYIKRWLPELAKVPAAEFLQPPASGRPLVPGYPLPMVDHATERNRTLALFAKHRQQGR
jgi:deoxyribodipyrimidine photo-lyase